MLHKDFPKATIQDIKRIVAEFNKSGYADWTKNDLRVALKRFYRWQRGLPKNKDPPETEWIKISNSNGKQILPEELLAEEDIQKMLEVCENSRDRAFLLAVCSRIQNLKSSLNILLPFLIFAIASLVPVMLVYSGIEVHEVQDPTHLVLVLTYLRDDQWPLANWIRIFAFLSILNAFAIVYGLMKEIPFIESVVKRNRLRSKDPS
jgi:hypothetical protein